MGRIGFPELLIILAILLFLFGPSRLPSLVKSLGEGLREFRKVMEGREEEGRKEKGKID